MSTERPQCKDCRFLWPKEEGDQLPTCRVEGPKVNSIPVPTPETEGPIATRGRGPPKMGIRWVNHAAWPPVYEHQGCGLFEMDKELDS